VKRKFLGAAASLAILTGCGQPSASHRAPDYSGSGEALVISPGVTVSNATYSISGPNGFASAGMVPVGDSPDLSIVLNGLPIGAGYEISVAATASDGVTVCEAMASFDVTGSTTNVPVHLTCGAPSGSVQLTGSLNVCPVLDGLDAIPAEAVVGGQLTLTATAHDSDNGPSPLSYKWTANGAALNHPEPVLTFTCTTAGTFNLKVAVSDGDPNPGCGDDSTAVVTCDP
jgi:hypothetical protein